MSTHDREVNHDGPCPCGSGRIEVIFWSPNHMFGRGRWEASFECARCKEEFVLRHQRGNAWLERRSELDEREAVTAHLGLELALTAHARAVDALGVADGPPVCVRGASVTCQ